MKIVVLNGSPRKGGNTEIMTEALTKDAEKKGHEVVNLPVGTMKIRGCMACEYCFSHNGECAQKDDMTQVYAELKDADMVVFDVMELYSDNKNKIVENAVPLDKEEYLKLLLIRQRRYELCFRFCKKELYKGLELDTEIGFGEDYATTPRLVCIANKVVKLDSICYYYIKYNQSSYTKSISVKAVQSIERAMLLLESFFQNRDCCEYNEILQISKMYLKVHMLKGTVYNAESFLYANNLFPELHNASLSQIKFKDNILLLINRYKWYGILKVYIKLGLALANKK